MHIDLVEFLNAAEYGSLCVSLTTNVALGLLPGLGSMSVVFAKLWPI